MALARISVLIEEQVYPNGPFLNLCPQGEFHLTSTSLRDLLQSASGSDLGSFQSTAPVLNSECMRFLCVPFKKRVSVFCNTLALLYASPAGFQNQMFQALVF